MSLNAAELKLLIAEGEGLTVEFKEKYTPRIDRDIVAMANSSGGFILLGVGDDRRVTGEKLTNQMKAEISSLARNCDPHVPMAKISQDGMTQKMTQKEVRLVFRAAADRSFERLPCKGFSPENVQLSAVRDFLKETGADLKSGSEKTDSGWTASGVPAGRRRGDVGAAGAADDEPGYGPAEDGGQGRGVRGQAVKNRGKNKGAVLFGDGFFA